MTAVDRPARGVSAGWLAIRPTWRATGASSIAHGERRRRPGRRRPVAVFRADKLFASTRLSTFNQAGDADHETQGEHRRRHEVRQRLVKVSRWCCSTKKQAEQGESRRGVPTGLTPCIRQFRLLGTSAATRMNEGLTSRSAGTRLKA